MEKVGGKFVFVYLEDGVCVGIYQMVQDFVEIRCNWFYFDVG